MRCMLVAVLEQDGYSVVPVRDGTELLEVLARSMASPLALPDILITDVIMPGYTGFGILAALRQLPWRIPVILITGVHNDTFESLAQRLGASALIRKPFDIDDLRAAILNVCQETMRHRRALE